MASDEELAEFARVHLLYEANLFVGLAAAIQESRGELTTEDFDVWTNFMARLETFGVKARLWRDFFYRDSSTHSDDVLAVNYAPTWPQHRKPVTTELEDAKVRADKLAVHLTLREQALAGVAHGWPPLKLGADVRVRLGELIQLTPMSRIDSDTRDQLMTSLNEFDKFVKEQSSRPALTPTLSPEVRAMLQQSGGVPTLVFSPPLNP